MTEAEIAACAEALAQAYRSDTHIEALPTAPSSVADAHAIQDRVAALLGKPAQAYKAGVAADGEPRRGLIYPRLIRPSPARVAPAEAPHFGVEGEIGFRFLRDLPARRQPYTRDEVATAVAVLPAIEVVSSRFRDPLGRPPLEQLADCGINGGLVFGTELSDWSHLDLPRLHVTLLVNGEPVLEHQGGHPNNDPLGPAVSLVDMLRVAGSGVEAGQIVITGSCTDGLRFLRHGDRCTVRFEGLGEAEVVFDD